MSASSILDQQIINYNQGRNCSDKSTLCHAPSLAMYFGRDGVVSACCSSRVSAYGSWPEMSVDELWFGNLSRNGMRDALSQNLLPKGCDRCADQLRAGSFVNLQASRFDTLPKAKPSSSDRVYPARMDFELSNKCNLECIQCSGFFSSSIRSNVEMLPTLPAIYDSRFVEQLRPFIPHLKEAKFLGGEPFLIDIYYEIWELFIELNPTCVITIISNGTVFTPKVQRIIDKLNCDIIVSIDSLQKESYEAIRRNANFEKTFSNLQSIVAINASHGRESGFSISPMIENWREMPEIVAWATERQIRTNFTVVVRPKELSLRNASPELLNEVVETYNKVGSFGSGPVAEFNNNAFADLRRHITMWRHDRDAVLELEYAYQDLHSIQPASSAGAGLFALEVRRAKVRGICRKLSAQFPDTTSPAARALIIALIDEFPDAAQFRAVLEKDASSDAYDRLAAYFACVWEVGNLLVPFDVLPDSHFDQQRLADYLAFYKRTFAPPILNQLYGFAIQRPLETLTNSASGTLEETIEVVTKYFSAGARPAATGASASA